MRRLKLTEGWLDRNTKAAKKSARKLAAVLAATPSERVTYDKRGELDEVSVEGSAYLERMDKRSWFLSMTRKDGTSTAIWIEGTVTMTEERE